MEDMDKYPSHPVLARPWTYRVSGLSFRLVDGGSSAELDLVLARGEEELVLRFHGVHELEIDKGFPWVGSGLEILDESRRGMENARVRVGSFEQDPGIRFWARSVERIRS